MPVDKMLFISSGCFVRLSIVFCLPRIYRDSKKALYLLPFLADKEHKQDLL